MQMPVRGSLFNDYWTRRNRIPILEEGRSYLPGRTEPLFRPAEVLLDVKRVTFMLPQPMPELYLKENYLRHLRLLEAGRRKYAVLTSHSALADLKREEAAFWWGWTLFARGRDIYTIQSVVYPRCESDLLGEADQGSILEVPIDMLSPWHPAEVLLGAVA